VQKYVPAHVGVLVCVCVCVCVFISCCVLAHAYLSVCVCVFDQQQYRSRVVNSFAHMSGRS